MSKYATDKEFTFIMAVFCFIGLCFLYLVVTLPKQLKNERHGQINSLAEQVFWINERLDILEGKRDQPRIEWRDIH